MPTLLWLIVWPIVGLFGRNRWLEECRVEFDSF